MKKRLTRISEGSGKTMVALALVSLLALPIFCLYAHYSTLATTRKEARMKPKELKQRAAAICVALGADKPVINEPLFIAQKPSGRAEAKLRHLWVVDCLAGSHAYNLIFNDVTGNIESIYAEGLNISSRAAAKAGMAVNSQSDAVEGAVRRLKDLQIISKGTRIALAEQPERDPDGITWRMVWKVLPPQAKKPFEVRMAINGYDATPLKVVNYNEMERYAQN